MAYYYVYPFAVSGDRAAVPTTYDGSGTLSYQNGFTENYQLILGTDPDALPIPRDQSNQIYYDVTNNVKQYQEHGFPDWISAADNNPGGVPTPYAYDLYAFVRYNDGSGMKVYQNLVQGNTDTPGVLVSSWLVVSGGTQSVAPGTIIAFGGTTAPDGYLECNGGTQLRVGTYARLFAAIGTTWGAGNGTTTFGIPDLRGRTLIHRGGAAVPNINGTNGIGNAVGNVGGASTITLAIGQIPSHTHGYLFPGAAASGKVSGYSIAANSGVAQTSGATGDGGAHNNVQMSAVVLYCIKY